MQLRYSDRRPFVTSVPSGVQPAILVGIYDLGTVYEKRFNRRALKVDFVWELVGQFDPKGEPLTIDKRYTQSLLPSSLLRKDLTSWNCARLIPDDDAMIDVRDWLGRPCRLVVVHSTKQDRLYANVEGVMPWPEGVAEPRPLLPLVSYEMDRQLHEIPEGTPPWIVSRIQASPEYARMLRDRGVEVPDPSPRGRGPR